ncbi:MAG TPA: LamG-like jellyroll fold domain-containing protein [Solirubrobacteraceae bacterium]|nr:LamG-like jellyroll fold domain-containing protein [Solirubrobacteraceae bacterium]
MIGGALLALLVSGAPAWAAPFANGSFETPAINTDYVTRVAPYNFGNWRVAAGSVDHKNTYWQAASGQRSIDLNGGDPGRLCQIFDTPTQGPARVGFMMSHNPDDGNLSGTLRVRVNGVLVGAPFVHNAANTLANMMWQSRSVTFNVATPTINLCFQSVTPGAQGPAIDAVTFTSLNYGGEVASDGPLVWYRLGENSAAPLLDSAPPPQDGTCVNGVTFGLAGALANDADTARGFDGRAAYCYANNITAPTTAYTIEGWMKLASASAGTVAEHGGSGALYVTTNSFCMRNAWEGMCWPSTPAVGTWYHMAATWSATDGIARLYVNGVLRASAVNGARPSGTSTFYVGYGQSAPWFHGTIDEVAYYPTALSAARIAAHYGTGCGC